MGVILRQRFTKVVSAGAVVAAVAGSCLVTVPAASAAPAAGCAPVTIVMMAGTGETHAAANPNQPVGMLKGVTDRVKTSVGDNVSVIFPAYSASAFNKGLNYVQSKQTGIDSLKHTLTSHAGQCASTQFVLGGYSQGADVAGDVASDIGNNRGPIPADKVLAVALLADPGRGTPGEALVGPNANRGVGMGGNRPGGMGSLSGRVATICDTGTKTTPGDMYCNLDRQKYPLVSSISQMLATTPAEAGVKQQNERQMTGLPGTTGVSPTGQQSPSQLTSAMTTDWSSANLGQLGSNVSTLAQTLGNAPRGGQAIDLGQIASTASSVSNTLQPLQQLIGSGTVDPTTTKDLSAAPAGSPDRAALTVLNNANKADLSGAVSTSQQLATTASTLAQQSGSSGSSSSLDPGQVQQLSALSGQLGQQTAPLTATPAPTMATASNVLSVLAPQKVIEQVLNVVVGLGSTNWIGMVNGLSMTVQRAVALDVPGVRKSAQEINEAIAPLVKMAAQVDFKWIASILRMIPDPSGYTQIAATVLDFVGNLDIIRLVNNVQRIQGIAFDVLEQRNLVRLADLVPVGLDLATVASGVLNGGTKTPASAYQPNLVAGSTLSNQVAGADFLGLTNSMIQLVSSEDANNLAGLVDAGVEVSQFVGGATRNHVAYGNYQVDNSGRSAIEWLAEWITLKVQRVQA
ncbi:cutinase family protein [uncultured Gordonia sp.]|uniref:cutinase family protein n=1 Tax=uncultured Gordonia sp. TaxID=198437 RepID=UPI002598EA70|nr:cutinase family protein [uncultured Gordonia sp.]